MILFGRKNFCFKVGLILLTFIVSCLFSQSRAQAAGKQQLHGHFHAAFTNAPLIGPLPPSTMLTLAIGLPLRNQEALDLLIERLYDRKSSQYRRFLTSEQFAQMFGPSETDYQAVINFAKSKNLEIVDTYSNRALLAVSGTAGDIEKAFYVHFQIHKRQDGSSFYACDAEPSVDLDVPLSHIGGLDNYSIPKPGVIFHDRENAKVGFEEGKKETHSGYGTGPSGCYSNNSNSYWGNDFRNVYVPGTSLNGTGQTIALVEFDSYYLLDIDNYGSATGITVPTLTNVQVPTGQPTFTPSGGQDEVDLDIEMLMSMAPEASIRVYEENTSYASFLPSLVLTQIATDDLAQEISSSWTWGGYNDSTVATAFSEYAAQGQSFFQDAGDDGAYITADPDPVVPQPIFETALMTVVGGTALTTSGTGTNGNPTPVGTYVSETTWNDSPGVAETATPAPNAVGGGGICSGPTPLPIPTWQVPFINSNNLGSSSYRNIPDVSLIADKIYIYADDGLQGCSGGTSAATPLWAAFIALVNQQGASNNNLRIGFANPALYQIAASPTPYYNDFHDIADGSTNNYWYPTPTPPSLYTAVTGYDLATGLGSPKPGLINDLISDTANNFLFCYSTQWGTSGTGNGQFSGPLGIAVNSTATTVYVSDNSNNRVELFNPSGTYLTSWGSSGSGNGQFEGPAQVALDASNNVYVVDTGNHRVQVFNPAGSLLMIFGSGGTGNGKFAGAVGIAVDSNGYIYVGDQGNYRVQKFNSQGTYVAKWGTQGHGNGQFDGPGSPLLLAVDDNNNVYATDPGNYRVDKFSSTGTYLGQWGSQGSGQGQFEGVEGITVGPCGYNYVSDNSLSNIQVFTNTGTYVGMYGSSGSGNGQFNGPIGVVFDNSNNLYVADNSNNRVQKLTSCGLTCAPAPTPTPVFCYSCQWGSQGTGNGQFYASPYGIAYSASATLSSAPATLIYVSSTIVSRVQEFQANSGCWSWVANLGTSGSGNGQFNNPSQIVVDGSGNVYVVEISNARVQKFNSSGTFLMKFGSSGTGNGQFLGPYGVAVNSAGTTIWVADTANNRIQYFSVASNVATYQGQWNSWTSGGVTYNFGGLNEIAFDGTYLYAADGGNYEVEKFGPTGSFQTSWGTQGNGFNQFQGPWGIDVGPCGNIYVSDSTLNRIQIYNTSGNYLGAYNSVGNGSLNGQLNSPMGFTFDGSNNLYVDDANNYRVEEFSACGLPSTCSTPISTPWPSLRRPVSSSSLADGVDVTSTPTPTITPTPTVSPTPVAGTLVVAPNISRGGTPIKFQVNLGQSTKIQLALFTVTGEQVYQSSGEGNAGENTISWNLQNQAGSLVASGLYIYVVRFDNGQKAFTRIGKVVVLR